MQRSPYLQQALQELAQQPQMPAPQGPDPAQLADFAKKGQAFRKENPGQSFIMHNLRQAGSNLMNTPARLGETADRLGGLFGLGRAAGAR